MPPLWWNLILVLLGYPMWPCPDCLGTGAQGAYLRVPCYKCRGTGRRLEPCHS